MGTPLKQHVLHWGSCRHPPRSPGVRVEAEGGRHCGQRQFPRPLAPAAASPSCSHLAETAAELSSGISVSQWSTVWWKADCTQHQQMQDSCSPLCRSLLCDFAQMLHLPGAAVLVGEARSSLRPFRAPTSIYRIYLGLYLWRASLGLSSEERFREERISPGLQQLRGEQDGSWHMQIFGEGPSLHQNGAGMRKQPQKLDLASSISALTYQSVSSISCNTFFILGNK